MVTVVLLVGVYGCGIGGTVADDDCGGCSGGGGAADAAGRSNTVAETRPQHIQVSQQRDLSAQPFPHHNSTLT